MTSALPQHIQRLLKQKDKQVKFHGKVTNSAKKKWIECHFDRICSIQSNIDYAQTLHITYKTLVIYFL